MKILNKRLAHVQVEVTRTIRQGTQYNIAPTYGYEGIDRGVVRVKHIGYIEDLYADSSVDEDVARDIQNHIEIEVSNRDKEEQASLKKELDESIWVAYTYHSNREQYVLPLDTFVEHTSFR